MISIKMPDTLHVESVPIDSIRPHPKNVRVHNEKNISIIMRSLSEFGQRIPLVLDVDGQIIKGNGTYAAAKSLGWTTIQVVRSPLEGSRAEQFAIIDNRASDTSDFDWELLTKSIEEQAKSGLDVELTGFAKYELQPLLHPEESSTDTKSKKEPGVYIPNGYVYFPIFIPESDKDLFQKWLSDTFEISSGDTGVDRGNKIMKWMKT